MSWSAHRSQWLLVSIVLAAAGCSSPDAPPDVGPQDPRWSQVLSQHTRGIVSRRDRIRVVFADDVITEGRVGSPATGLLITEPAVAGSVSFASRREVVLTPNEDLTPGQSFVVSLRRGDVAGLPEDLPDYRFVIEVMEQDFEVAVVGLSPDPERDSTLILTGSVATADVDDPGRVERTVSASLAGRSLTLAWEHATDGRRHTFTAPDIRRGELDQELTLTWDGQPLSVDHRGSRTVTIPSMGTFVVTRIDAIRGTRQYIAARFSDDVDPRQNLTGLVGIEGTPFTTSVERNEIRLYPSQAVAGQLVVSLEPGIRSADGKRLETRSAREVSFAQNGPGVRFAGRGVILPEDDRLTIPIEAVNVSSVQVTAFRVFETNMGEFLQNNSLSGGSQMGRVGRYLWRRTLPLRSPVVDTWTRYALDLTDLMAAYPGEMLRLTVSINRGNSTYACSDAESLAPPLPEPPLRDQDDAGYFSARSWDYAEEYFGYGIQFDWRERDDPCRDSYYRYSNQVSDSRNFLASNIGMVAKRDEAGSVFVATTDLRTAEPLSGAAVTFYDFQGQPLTSVTTDRDGFARTGLERVPFYATAERNGDQGYLRMSAGAPLTTSHFDVGGTTVAGGLKGMIYGERGVWRPGDPLHLTFVLQDETDRLPEDHPATLQLSDPRGRRVLSITNNEPVDGFYSFAVDTDAEAPTGTWNASVEVGGARFTKSLKVETVIPNRLRVDLDVGGDQLRGGGPIDGDVFGQWLTGAVARNLRADVQVRLRPARTSFDGYDGYLFDDPARDFRGDPQTIFDGELDSEGRARFEATLAPGGQPAGFLTAGFTSRVFERGGAFSTSHSVASYSPYTRYVGVRVPAGDRRGTLLTDTTHAVQIATVDAEGEPVSVEDLEVTLYKIDWRWWWDRSGESLAQYTTARSRAVVEQSRVSTTSGSGTFPLRVDYPAWGRYLLRVCDTEQGHCTGKVLYIDWPGWAGRAREESAEGATVLVLQADREEYSVGDVARIELPPATQGRALVSLENGTRLLDQRWVEMTEDRSRVEVPITADMSPTGYVSVTLVQPHAGRDNDLPIRLYGIIPLAVSDPQTRLEPVVEAPEEWRPETMGTIRVSESRGREMTYTVAVVDEGLLDLTNFQTPELHDHFYQKEALGVDTWDLFDDVVGAYGGELERLLALGGSDSEELGEAEPSRYPPMVRFLGPFTLDARGTAEHTIDIPRYVGAVRVMVVAGHDAAYGSTSRSVYVREPLSVLATLPRVVGPDEEITLPVSLFAMTEDVRDATVRVETDDHFQVVGDTTASVVFDGLGEQMAFLRLRVGSELGFGQVRVEATSGQHTSRASIDLEVRSPNPAETRAVRQVIAAGERWAPVIETFGLPGTNRVTLELSSLPPLNLDRRLKYLIRYPYGCVEQVTSAAFPQMYLPDLIALDQRQRDSVQSNVETAIARLTGFQVPTGSFTYWPGGFGNDLSAQNIWSTNYVGHFLVEADRRGYYVPPEMISDWVDYQSGAAQSWTSGTEDEALQQAYRLYTLALAGRAEMGAMNRLRAGGELGYATSWYLAGAYGLAGLPDVARQIIQAAPAEPPDYRQPGWSFGSRLRDQAVRLNTLGILGRTAEAETLAKEISDELYSERWHSTHSLAWALIAMSRHYADAGTGRPFTFEMSRGGGDFTAVRPSEPVYSTELSEVADGVETLEILNLGEGVLYGTVSVEGVPAAGDERAAASGLALDVRYVDAGGSPIDPGRLPQGTDVAARITVTNRSGRAVRNLALEHRVPAGWEIQNPRLDPLAEGAPTNFDYQDVRDDRVNTFFSLSRGQTRTFTTLVNAAYLGTYHLPSISVEAMYDASVFARTAGRAVQVVEANR